jgi:hypothetical protein
MIVPDATNGNGEKNGRIKERLQTTFVVIAIVSFSLTILVNYYTLRRLRQGK